MTLYTNITVEEETIVNPLDNENETHTKLDEYLGEIYRKIASVPIPYAWLNGVELDLTLDGRYFGKKRVVDEKIDLSEDEQTYYAVAGFAYQDQLDFPPFQGGSVLGSSHGSQGQLKSAILSVYKSRPCKIAMNSPRDDSYYSKVAFPKAPNDDIFSGDVKCLPLHSGSYTDRGLSIRSTLGEPFNLCSTPWHSINADISGEFEKSFCFLALLLFSSFSMLEQDR